MAIIKLTKGYEAIVDDWNYDRLNKFLWHAQEKKNLTYGVRNAYRHEWPTRRDIYLHHQVLNVMPWELDGREVDHRDRNPLNCREENLHLVSHRENIHNSKSVINRRGVYYNVSNKRWQAFLMPLGKNKIYLGTTATEEEARALIEKHQCSP
jgi:HNH endonuclease